MKIGQAFFPAVGIFLLIAGINGMWNACHRTPLASVTDGKAESDCTEGRDHYTFCGPNGVVPIWKPNFTVGRYIKDLKPGESGCEYLSLAVTVSGSGWLLPKETLTDCSKGTDRVWRDAVGNWFAEKTRGVQVPPDNTDAEFAAVGFIKVTIVWKD